MRRAVKAQTLPTAQKCAECGAELKATSKFCPACGKPVVDRQAETAVQTVKHDTEVTKAKEQINRGIKTIAQTVERTMFSAPVTPGEFALGSVRMLPSPTTIISGGFNNVLLSFKNFFKTPKSFIPTLAISAVWLILYILKACNITLPMPQLIKTITLYGAGMSTNPLFLIGGLVGKGVFASAIVSLVYKLSGKRSNAKRGFLKMLEGWVKCAMEMGGKAIGKLIGDICGFIYMEFLKTSMTESVQRAGREAFDSALREGIKYN